MYYILTFPENLKFDRSLEYLKAWGIALPQSQPRRSKTPVYDKAKSGAYSSSSDKCKYPTLELI